MKKHVPSNKNGAILVIVMAVLVAFSLMVVALLQLGSFNEMETIRQLRITQAHWMAEAGLERALSRVMGTTNFLPGTSGTISENFSGSELLGGLGSYEVRVHKTNYNNTVTAGYGITSIGKAGNNAVAMTNEVRLTFEAGPGGQQALIALGTNTTSTIAANTSVDGTIYVEGTLRIANGVHEGDLSDIIDAGTIAGNTNAATAGELPNPGPPTLDQGPYSNALNTAATYTNAHLIIGTTNLNGTLYVNGNVKIDASATVTGPGTIVATGTVETDGQVIIGADVKIVARGNVEFKNQVTLGNRVEVFSLANITFATHGSGGSDSTANGVILLAIGNISTKNIDFNGIIYAEGRVNVTSGSDIRGTVIAKQGFDLAANVDVTYDPSVFANQNPINYGGAHYIVPSTWQWSESPF
jgi:cytoskeletal protein CcmA (bactofilin family)/Tfp pilus assembly protein PilX